MYAIMMILACVALFIVCLTIVVLKILDIAKNSTVDTEIVTIADKEPDYQIHSHTIYPGNGDESAMEFVINNGGKFEFKED